MPLRNPSHEHSFVIKRVNRVDRHRKTTERLIKGSDLCILRCLGGRRCLLFDRRSFKINNIDCRTRSSGARKRVKAENAIANYVTVPMHPARLSIPENDSSFI